NSKIFAQVNLNSYEDRIKLLRGEKPHQERKKGKGKELSHDSYIFVDNSGCREIITKAVKSIDYLSRNYDKTNLSFTPVVKKGKTIMTVMNKLRNVKTC